MDILDDIGVSKLSANCEIYSE